MPVILRRPSFLHDLNDAWTFIATRNPAAADAFIRELEQRYDMLSNDPLAGTAPFRRHRDHRVFPYGSYLIIYRPLEQQTGIELVRLIHATRDYRRIFDRR